MRRAANREHRETRDEVEHKCRAPSNWRPGYYAHESLDVYRVARAFVAVVQRLRAGLPRGSGYLADHLDRAAVSIALNIAEGASKPQPGERRRFFACALGSAGECSAALDLLALKRLLPGALGAEARMLLGRLGAMLARLARYP